MLKRLSALFLVSLMAGCTTTNHQQASNDIQDASKSQVSSHAGHWLTDMKKAQAAAKLQGKDLFIFLTGSDWCQWCQVLEKEVLSQPEFLEYAKENLVLVELDFPSDESSLSKEQLAHNNEWKDKLPNSEGFPTVFLTDSSVAAYGMAGYEEGGAQKYVEMLKKLNDYNLAVAELSAKANKASGLERAKLLDKLLGYQEKGVIVKDAAGKIAEVVSLTENKDKVLFKKYQNLRVDQEINASLKSVYGDGSSQPTTQQLLDLFDQYKHVKDGVGIENIIGSLGDSYISTGKVKEGVAFMDKIIADKSYSLDVRQASRLFQGIITAYGSKAEGRMGDAIDFFQQAMDMNPESVSGQRAKAMLQDLSKQSGV